MRICARGALALLFLSLAAARPALAQAADQGTEQGGATPDAVSAPTAAEASTGAPSTVQDPADAVSAVSAASAPGPAAPGHPFLGFPSAAAFHTAAGWGSTGLLLAAGAVGAVRAWDLMSAGHAYRDANNIDEDQIGSVCSAKINEVWKADQTLRWVHVGLLVSGETLYLADAATGISWIDPTRPASLRSNLHRWAFYGHAALMAAEVVLGFVATDALQRGDHELVSSLGVAHAAIGIAIPVLIGGAGLIESIP